MIIHSYTHLIKQNYKRSKKKIQFNNQYTIVPFKSLIPIVATCVIVLAIIKPLSAIAFAQRNLIVSLWASTFRFVLFKFENTTWSEMNIKEKHSSWSFAYTNDISMEIRIAFIKAQLLKKALFTSVWHSIAMIIVEIWPCRIG